MFQEKDGVPNYYFTNFLKCPELFFENSSNYHIVKSGKSCQIIRNKQITSATIYAYDANKDICLLEWVKQSIELEKKKDRRGMIDLGKEWTKAEPESEEAWHKLGVSYFEIEQYDNAIDTFKNALRIDPELASACFNLGSVYINLKQYDHAIEAYKEALRINPEDTPALHNIALAYYSTGNLAAAMNAIEELRRFDPARADKLFNFITTSKSVNN
jgi:tetratricopeptide (TPR) repeat protein